MSVIDNLGQVVQIISDSQKEIEELESTIDSLKRKVAHKEDIIVSKNEIISKLKQEIETLIDANKNLREHISALTEQTETLIKSSKSKAESNKKNKQSSTKRNKLSPEQERKRRIRSIVLNSRGSSPSGEFICSYCHGRFISGTYYKTAGIHVCKYCRSYIKNPKPNPFIKHYPFRN